MNCHDLIPDPDLAEQRLESTKQLSVLAGKTIDRVLLKNCSSRWSKVSMVVANTMVEFSDRYDDIPDIYYARRLKKLIRNGFLESRGDLSRLRQCEVRIHLRVV